MSQADDQGVKFFLTYKRKVQTLSPKAQDYLSIYMSSRLAAFTLDSKDVGKEDVVKSERLILEQLKNPTKQRAELVSSYAEENAYAVKGDGKLRWIYIGYWSSICYWFMFSKTRDLKFIDHVYVAFVDGIDDYFIDDDPTKINNENANFLKAYATVQLINLDRIPVFMEWTKSVGPGEKLLNFEKWKDEKGQKVCRAR